MMLSVAAKHMANNQRVSTHTRLADAHAHPQPHWLAALLMSSKQILQRAAGRPTLQAAYVLPRTGGVRTTLGSISMVGSRVAYGLQLVARHLNPPAEVAPAIKLDPILVPYRTVRRAL
jgi:hypothetical protein